MRQAAPQPALRRVACRRSLTPGTPPACSEPKKGRKVQKTSQKVPVNGFFAVFAVNRLKRLTPEQCFAPCAAGTWPAPGWLAAPCRCAPDIRRQDGSINSVKSSVGAAASLLQWNGGCNDFPAGVASVRAPASVVFKIKSMPALQLFKCLNPGCGLTSTLSVRATAQDGAFSSSCIHCETLHDVRRNPAGSGEAMFRVTGLSMQAKGGDGDGDSIA
jgi:hypothetical protein